MVITFQYCAEINPLLSLRYPAPESARIFLAQGGEQVIAGHAPAGAAWRRGWTQHWQCMDKRRLGKEGSSPISHTVGRRWRLTDASPVSLVV